eukprot:GHVP01043982.1.p1 GENE.GHVP01043982.1~~GHVP01043982.1.p1  ORF type:complete len:207 (+),score=38.10 GHVP01043982.1:2-622(+)
MEVSDDETTSREKRRIIKEHIYDYILKETIFSYKKSALVIQKHIRKFQDGKKAKNLVNPTEKVVKSPMRLPRVSKRKLEESNLKIKETIKESRRYEEEKKLTKYNTGLNEGYKYCTIYYLPSNAKQKTVYDHKDKENNRKVRNERRHTQDDERKRVQWKESDSDDTDGCINNRNRTCLLIEGQKFRAPPVNRKTKIIVKKLPPSNN